MEPILPNEQKIGLTQEEWRDDPESIAAWIPAVDKLEPMVWADGEREAYERYREECRQFNIAAVRTQMEATPDDETPSNVASCWTRASPRIARLDAEPFGHRRSRSGDSDI